MTMAVCCAAKRHQYGLDKSLISVCGRLLQNFVLEAVRDDWAYDVVDTEKFTMFAPASTLLVPPKGSEVTRRSCSGLQW